MLAVSIGKIIDENSEEIVYEFTSGVNAENGFGNIPVRLICCFWMWK